MLWTLQLADEPLTVPLPASWYCENLQAVGEILERYGKRPPISFVSDVGHVIRPVRQDSGPVEWWEVVPPGVVRPDLRSAFVASTSE